MRKLIIILIVVLLCSVPAIGAAYDTPCWRDCREYCTVKYSKEGMSVILRCYIVCREKICADPEKNPYSPLYKEDK